MRYAKILTVLAVGLLVAPYALAQGAPPDQGYGNQGYPDQGYPNQGYPIGLRIKAIRIRALRIRLWEPGLP